MRNTSLLEKASNIVRGGGVTNYTDSPHCLETQMIHKLAQMHPEVLRDYPPHYPLKQTYRFLTQLTYALEHNHNGGSIGIRDEGILKNAMLDCEQCVKQEQKWQLVYHILTSTKHDLDKELQDATSTNPKKAQEIEAQLTHNQQDIQRADRQYHDLQRIFTCKAMRIQVALDTIKTHAVHQGILTAEVAASITGKSLEELTLDDCLPTYQDVAYTARYQELEDLSQEGTPPSYEEAVRNPPPQNQATPNDPPPYERHPSP